MFDEILEFDILPKVEKPSRYTGGEMNQVVKDWDAARLRFGLIFPDLYEIGMSNNGILILYHLINRIDWALCERAFSVWPDMEAALKSRNKPLYSLESRRPLNEFNILGFSLGYEMAFSNILAILDLSNVPFYTKDRRPEDPFVIAGGCTTFNTEPIADFMDFALIGEGEEATPQILEAFDRLLQNEWGGDRSKIDRERMLREMAKIDGVYVPSLYKVSYQGVSIEKIEPVDATVPPAVRKREVWDMATAEFPMNPVFSSMRVVHDRAAVEVFRGCTEGCRYCQAGMIYRPRRERPKEQSIEMAKTLQKNLGVNEIALQSLNTIDYTGLGDTLKELTDYFFEEKVSLSIPSTRLDSYTEAIGEKLRVVRNTGLTFAPEAGSQRLRDAINRPITEEQIFESIRSSFSTGIHRVKLYFVIGFPSETDEDVLAIPELVRKMQAVAREHKKTGGRRHVDFHVSVSNLVPKCFTPFQWKGQNELEELRRKQFMLRRAFDSFRGVKLSLHNRYISFWEAVFSRGDRRLAPAMVEGWRLGARFDSWDEHFSHERWLEAFENVGLNPEDFANRDYAPDEVFPWQAIDAGVTHKFLRREWDKAFKGKYTEDCYDGRCAACGMPCLTIDRDLELAADAAGQEAACD